MRTKGPSKKRFDAVFSLGKRVKGEFVRISTLRGSGMIGVAVSRKIGSKPRRNRIRRRVKSALAGVSNLVDGRLDYVIVVNAEAMQASYQNLDADVRAILAKVRERWESELESS